MFQTGIDNPQWKGGVAEYPNHSLLKKRRLTVLQKATGKCQICNNRPPALVHHIDGSVANHNLDNLIAVCNPCHKALHNNDDHTRKRTSKYVRKYGLTLTEMTKRFGGTIGFYGYLEKAGKLREFLDERSSSETTETLKGS